MDSKNIAIFSVFLENISRFVYTHGLDVSEIIERVSTVSENSTLENIHRYVTLKVFDVELDDLFHLLVWRNSDTFQTNAVSAISKTH